MKASVRKACGAVYTRVSADERLDMTFNSLDAQGEAVLSCIQSQKYEGWIVACGRYDGGGFSGGTMERPALQRLLRHVKNDVIVVYKVDRLSRSLTEFACIVEIFKCHSVFCILRWSLSKAQNVVRPENDLMHEEIMDHAKPGLLMLPLRWNVAVMPDSLGTFRCSCSKARSARTLAFVVLIIEKTFVRTIMAHSYTEPVAKLLSCGAVAFASSPRQWFDYRDLGLTEENIPELIRMATDLDLHDARYDSPEVWAPLHAGRALAQLQAVEAARVISSM